MYRVLLVLFVSGFSFILSAQSISISENIFQYRGNLGIGVEAPDHQLTIVDNASRYDSRQFLDMHNTNQGSHSHVAVGMHSGYASNKNYGSVGTTGNTYSAIPQMSGYTYLYGQKNGLTLRAADKKGIIRFWAGGDRINHERMRITSDGFVGIGTTEPKARVHVANGDVYISEIKKGIVMRSPDGQCWRGTVDVNGNLNFQPLDCMSLDNTVSVDTRSYSTNIAVFPNPTQGPISIAVSGKVSNVIHYSIHNLNAIVVSDGTLSSNMTDLDLSKFPTGTYIMQFSNENGTVIGNQKIFKH